MRVLQPAETRQWQPLRRCKPILRTCCHLLPTVSAGSGTRWLWQCSPQQQSLDGQARRLLRLHTCSSSSGGSKPLNLGVQGDDQYALMLTTLARLKRDSARAKKKRLQEAQEQDAGDSEDATITDDLADAKPPPKVPHRWRVVIMMALAFVLCNMDKVNMSVAVIPMAEELGWSASDRGLVSSAFFWGYSITQIPAGYLSTRIGGATVLLAGVAFWSLGTLVAPPLAHYSLLALCVSRVLVGLGEGLAPSSATNIMSRLIPEGERTRAVTMVFGSLDLGSVVGLLACGPLIRRFGWPSVFYLFAVMGLVWASTWPLLKAEESDPTQPPPPPPAKASSKAVPWLTFLKSAPVWAIIVAHFCYNWGYYTLLAWLPSFFELALGLNVQNSSLLTLIPYIAMVAMNPVVGPVADGLVKRGWALTNVRKLAQGISFLGPAACLTGCSAIIPAGSRHSAGVLGPQSTAVIVVLLSLSFALGAWARGGLYCNHQDLSPKYAGALLGISNTAGAIPGIVGITSVGFLLDRTGSWGPSLFYPIIACYLFGLVVYTLFASSERTDFV